MTLDHPIRFDRVMKTCVAPRPLNVIEASRSYLLNHMVPTFNIDIERHSILETKFRPYLIAILAVVWALDMWQQRPLGSGGYGRYWRWYGFMAGLIYSLASKNQWPLALAVTACTITWSRFLDPPPSATGSSLPSFVVFLKSLPNTNTNTDISPSDLSAPPTTIPEPSSTAAPPPSSEPTCIVCWSSTSEHAEPLKILPCTHLVCPSCLKEIAASTQNHCPLCRSTLFTRPSTNPTALRITVLRAMVSLWNADIAVRALAVTLQICKSEGWARGNVFDGALVVWEVCYALWLRRLMLQQGEGEWWRLTAFKLFGREMEWRFAACGVLLLVFNAGAKVWEVGREDVKLIYVTR